MFWPILGLVAVGVGVYELGPKAYEFVTGNAWPPAPSPVPQDPFPLVNGQYYQVQFFAPAVVGGHPTSDPMLGQTRWMPFGNTLQKLPNPPLQVAGLPGSAPTTTGHYQFYDAYQMIAQWQGPTDSFYAVNPAVAGPNFVIKISPATVS